jgi:hypothetical protein
MYKNFTTKNKFSVLNFLFRITNGAFLAKNGLKRKVLHFLLTECIRGLQGIYGITKYSNNRGFKHSLFDYSSASLLSNLNFINGHINFKILFLLTFLHRAYLKIQHV